ncbi:hypothetical protein H6G52_12960 [Limnothrix sp. FACHB-881]|uniref:hypothetical protein n=1 Tax=Limnothrix sp. FACHB-881 TaxID=2692819 RepID=UPI001684A6DD|nr:hypothetical protein [Limnothrix sp. FACHB-881]MBD2636275.1 hypothetical protein [Limnothrix sp. FACHB-881]
MNQQLNILEVRPLSTILHEIYKTSRSPALRFAIKTGVQCLESTLQMAAKSECATIRDSAEELRRIW